MNDPFMEFVTDTAVGPDQTERNVVFNRRQLLKTMGGGTGAVASSFSLMIPVQAGASDHTSIIIGYERTNPDAPAEGLTPVEKDVPDDWYEDLQRARRAKAKIRQEFGGRTGVVGVGLEPGKYGGENASVQVDVLPDYLSELGGAVPEGVGDVPVRVVEGSGITPDGHSPCDDGLSNCNDYDHFSQIPGGMICEADETGTLMSRMYDENNNPRFATAGHLFDAKDATGESLYHPDSSHDAIGEVVRSHCYDDFVLAAGRNSHSALGEIEGVTPTDVNGHFSKNGVNDLMASDEYIKKMGQTSCQTCGTVESTEYIHWGYGCTPKDAQVVWGEASDSQAGDSGAPVFHENPNNSSYQWIVSFDLWSGSFSAGGTSAYSIVNTHGYSF